MGYLTRWRLQLAAQVLTSTSKSVAEVANDVGYESEPSFNRAFKRQFGLPPAQFRRASRSTRNRLDKPALKTVSQRAAASPPIARSTSHR